MKDDKLKLTKLILETKCGKKKIELSVKEAKELYEQLKGLFQGNASSITAYQPYCPIYIEKSTWPYYPNCPTWCGDTATLYSDNINVSYCCSEVNE